MRISDWSSDVCSSDLFQGGAAVYAGLLRQWLRLAGEGDAIMCHPASQALAEDGLGVQRLAEFQVLRSNAMSEIGRASCRERVCQYVSISVVAVSLTKQKYNNNIMITEQKRKNQ